MSKDADAIVVILIVLLIIGGVFIFIVYQICQCVIRFFNFLFQTRPTRATRVEVKNTQRPGDLRSQFDAPQRQRVADVITFSDGFQGASRTYPDSFHAICQHLQSYNDPRRPFIVCESAQLRSNQLNAWVKKLITRPPRLEPGANSKYIDIIEVDSANDARINDIVLLKLKQIYQSLDIGEKLYFHGTDAAGADSILSSGIILQKTSRKGDFSRGSGFYVSKRYERAVQWGHRKSERSWSTRGAVVAFRISRTLRKEQPHLALKTFSSQARYLWERVVLYYRSGINVDSIHYILQGLKFIKGPVNKNPSPVRGSGPVPFKFSQLCILDEDYARRFGSLENVSFVVYYNTGNKIFSDD